jgi:hypothetical protein
MLARARTIQAKRPLRVPLVVSLRLIHTTPRRLDAPKPAGLQHVPTTGKSKLWESADEAVKDLEGGKTLFSGGASVKSAL